MARYRLRDDAGSHSGVGNHAGSARTTQGEIVETDLDLIKMFPNKWEKIVEEDKPKMQGAPIGEKPEEHELQADSGVGWDDVTKDFESAGDNDLSVHHKKGVGYEVRDGERTLTEKALRSKTQVTAFLKQHLEGREDEESEEDDDTPDEE